MRGLLTKDLTFITFYGIFDIMKLRTPHDFARYAIKNVPLESSDTPTISELVEHVERDRKFLKSPEWIESTQDYVSARPLLCKTLYELQTANEWQQKSPHIRAANELISTVAMETQLGLQIQSITDQDGNVPNVSTEEYREIVENAYKKPEVFGTPKILNEKEQGEAIFNYGLSLLYFRQHPELHELVNGFIEALETKDFERRNTHLLSTYENVAFDDITRRAANFHEKNGLKQNEMHTLSR